jgi:hypothetical protein
MQAALSALLAVRANVSEQELDGWVSWVDGECSSGRLVRMAIDSVEACMRVEETIAALRKANGVKPKN